MALLFLSSCHNHNIENKHLILYNNTLGTKIASFPINENSSFSIKFIHSVNKSPVIDFYKFDKDNNIYVYKTIYYGFGAGVETELEGNEILEYGNDGSMIVSNISKRIDSLTYYLSSIYDHTLKIDDQDEQSLWELCGKNIVIRIEIE